MISEDTRSPKEGFILARWTALEQIRRPYLIRAYKYASITIPYLLQENDVSQEELQIDYAGVGAEYINHLANIYLDEMFPSHRSFFKLQLPASKMEQVVQDSKKTEIEIQQLFATSETEARWKFEKKHTRVALLDHIKQLIITGNSLLFALPDDAFVQNYAMDEYVILRDTSGKLMELITKDTVSVESLDPILKAKVLKVATDIDETTDHIERRVNIYTYIRRDKEDSTTFLVDQSVDAIPIGEQISYPENLLPWIPTCWNRVRREMWGRGLVEDHYGSFFGMSILVEALVIAGAIATDFKFLVKPGSTVDIVNLNNSASGTYHYGNVEDVKPIDLGKRTELEFVATLVDMYRKQLGKVFLVLSSQMRDAERVTVEENRLRAQELNKAHGGVFGNLAVTLQSPMAELNLRDIDILIKGSDVKPIIMTGLDAMGRAADNEKILYFFNDLAALATVPEPFQRAIKIPDLMTKLGTGRDIDTSFILTKEELAAQQEAEQEAQLKLAATQGMIDKSEPEQLAEGMQNA